MRPPNVTHFLYQRNDPFEEPITTLEFERTFNFVPDGINVYYGLSQFQVDRARQDESALAAKHRKPLHDVRDLLIRSGRSTMRVNFGLEPLEGNRDRCYAFVEEAPTRALIDDLARELNQIQEQAAAWGGTLDIVVRYASEMNMPGGGQAWGPGPELVVDPPQQLKYKRTFQMIREKFDAAAPKVRFAFSPILYDEIEGDKYDVLTDYWPGDPPVVNVISCTWYARRKNDSDSTTVPKAAEVLGKYLAHRRGRGLPFGIDEIGGCIGPDASAHGNDSVLQKMLEAFVTPAVAGNDTFDYMTFFLDKEWGVDAKLSFM